MDAWDRRAFLKASAVGTVGLLGETERRLLPSEPKPWNASSGRSLRKFRNPQPTVCRACPAHCAIVAFRDGDRVVQLLGNWSSPTNQGGLCARAYAGLERLYDRDRVLTPMRRTGPRGSGEWQPTSWNDALAEVAPRLRVPGTRSVLHLGQEEVLVAQLRRAFSWDQVLVDEPFPGSPSPSSGEDLYGFPALLPDAARARTIFLFGAGVLDGRFSVPLVRSLLAARHAGAEIRLFDAFEGVSGGAFTWEPVVPGAEASVALGLARLLLLQKRFDPIRFEARCADDPAELLAALSSYTPEVVERASGLSARRLHILAEALAAGTPAQAVASPDSGAAAGTALLNHLLGAVDSPGGQATAKSRIFGETLRPTGTPEAWLADLVRGRSRADLYWVGDANPAYNAPHSSEVAAALADPNRIGYLVVTDTHMTETAQLADLFLPLATPFESWGLVEGALPDGRPYLFLQQPVAGPSSEPRKLKDPQIDHASLFEPTPRPLGQARSLADALLVLASGREGGIPAVSDTREYLEEILKQSKGPGSLEALLRRGLWVSEDASDPKPRARVSLIRFLPRVSEPAQRGELRLLLRSASALPFGYSNTRWGMEIDHRVHAYLHRETGRRLGLENGDRIRLRAPGGEAEVPVRLIEGIHPNAVVLLDGLGHWAGGAAAVAKASGLDDPIWWEEEGPGASARALFPFRIGPNGLQDWGPLPVQVERA